MQLTENVSSFFKKMMTGFKSRTPPSDKVSDPLCQPSRNRYPLPSEPVFYKNKASDKLSRNAFLSSHDQRLKLIVRLARWLLFTLT